MFHLESHKQVLTENIEMRLRGKFKGLGLHS